MCGGPMEQIWAPKQCYDKRLNHMTHDSNLVLPSAQMDALPKPHAMGRKYGQGRNANILHRFR